MREMTLLFFGVYMGRVAFTYDEEREIARIKVYGYTFEFHVSPHVWDAAYCVAFYVWNRDTMYAIVKSIITDESTHLRNVDGYNPTHYSELVDWMPDGVDEQESVLRLTTPLVNKHVSEGVDVVEDIIRRIEGGDYFGVAEDCKKFSAVLRESRVFSVVAEILNDIANTPISQWEEYLNELDGELERIKRLF